jgi:hypothetical protein
VIDAVARFPPPMWHPMTLLLFWAGFALSLQLISSLLLLMLAATISLTLAAVFSGSRSRALLWRARWLFLSIGILFLFFTPGEYVPWTPAWLGLSYEGLARAGEQLARLLALLASLALLHERIGTHGLLTGLHTLLKPFSWRDATVVRLMLVLEHIEGKQETSWREWLANEGVGEESREHFTLGQPPLRGRDYWLMAGLLATAGGWMFLS